MEEIRWRSTQDEVLSKEHKFVVARQNPKVSNKWECQYTNFQSKDHFVEWYENREVKMCFELMTGTCYTMCDVDYDAKPIPTCLKEEIDESLKIDIKNYIETTLGISGGTLYMSTAHKLAKYSAHFTYVYSGKSWEKFVSQKGLWSGAKGSFQYGDWVDMSVYTKNRIMRVLHSSKWDEPKRPLITTEGTTFDHLITCEDTGNYFKAKKIVKKIIVPVFGDNTGACLDELNEKHFKQYQSSYYDENSTWLDTHNDMVCLIDGCVHEHQNSYTTLFDHGYYWTCMIDRCINKQRYVLIEPFEEPDKILGHDDEIEDTIEKLHPDIEYMRNGNTYTLYSANVLKCKSCGIKHRDNFIKIIVNKIGIYYHCTEHGEYIELLIFRVIPEIKHFDDLRKLRYLNLTLKEYKDLVKPVLSYISGGSDEIYVKKNISRGEMTNIYVKNTKMFSKVGCNLWNKEAGEYTRALLSNLVNDWDFSEHITKTNIIYRPYLNESDYICDENDYNLWNGFMFKETDDPIEYEKIEPLLWHMLHIMCDGNQKNYDHLEKIWAQYFQKPEVKTGVNVVFKSTKQGAGKNLPINILLKLFGIEHSITLSSLKDVTGDFNAIVAQKQLIIQDELHASTIEAANIMKSRITEGTVVIQPKYVDKYVIDDYSNYISLTNNDWNVRVEPGDRRHFCLDMNNSKAGDPEYFKPMIRLLEGDGLQSLFNYFVKEVNLDNWDAQDDMPNTDMKLKLKMNTLSGPALFTIEYLNKPGYVDHNVSVNDYFKKYTK